jgi:hypothetical protein
MMTGAPCCTARWPIAPGGHNHPGRSLPRQAPAGNAVGRAGLARHRRRRAACPGRGRHAKPVQLGNRTGRPAKSGATGPAARPSRAVGPAETGLSALPAAQRTGPWWLHVDDPAPQLPELTRRDRGSPARPAGYRGTRRCSHAASPLRRPSLLLRGQARGHRDHRGGERPPRTHRPAPVRASLPGIARRAGGQGRDTARRQRLSAGNRVARTGQLAQSTHAVVEVLSWGLSNPAVADVTARKGRDTARASAGTAFSLPAGLPRKHPVDSAAGPADPCPGGLARTLLLMICTWTNTPGRRTRIAARRSPDQYDYRSHVARTAPPLSFSIKLQRHVMCAELGRQPPAACRHQPAGLRTQREYQLPPAARPDGSG